MIFFAFFFMCCMTLFWVVISIAATILYPFGWLFLFINVLSAYFMYLTTSALIGHIKKSKKRKTILVKGTTATAILYKKQHAYTEHGSEQGGATWDYYKMEFIIKKADGDTFSISEIHIDFKAVILERLKVFPVKFINYDVVIPKTVFKDYKKANKRHRRKIETINPYFTNQEIEEFYSNLDLPV